MGPIDSFSGLVAAILERWRMVVACLLVGVVVAVGAFLVLPTNYFTTATVQVAAVSANPLTGTVNPVDMTTERIVAGSEVVARRAAEALGDVNKVGSLQSSLTVGNPSGSFILDFTATGPTPEAAAERANAFATAYLADREETARAIGATVNESLAAQIDTLQGTLAVASPAEAQAIADQIADLRGQQIALASLAIFPGTIVSQALAENGSARIGPMVFLVGGLALGGLVGLFAALVADRLDPRVRNSRRLAAQLHDTVLISSDAASRSEAVREGLLVAQAGCAANPEFPCVLAVVSLLESEPPGLSGTIDSARDEITNAAKMTAPSVGWVQDLQVTQVPQTSPSLQAALARPARVVLLLTQADTMLSAVEDVRAAFAREDSAITILGWFDRDND